MATMQNISLAEYLDTSYRPDREFIDGEIRERNVGKTEHARTQALLAAWLVSHEVDWNIRVGTEWRTQVATNRVRIPDIAVVRPGPQSDILTAAPLLLIEILSPDDTYAEIQERAQDYFAMGVTSVWIVDPTMRTGRMSKDGQWIEAARLTVQDTPIFVVLGDLFSRL